MTEDNKIQQAQQVYEAMCALAASHEWQHQLDEENLRIICSTAENDEQPIVVTAWVDAENSLVRAVSPLAFTVPQDKRQDLAMAISYTNDLLLAGSFDFNYYDEQLFFRLASSYADSQISQRAIKNLILRTASVKEDFSQSLWLLTQGKLTILQYIERVNEEDDDIEVDAGKYRDFLSADNTLESAAAPDAENEQLLMEDDCDAAEDDLPAYGFADLDDLTEDDLPDFYLDDLNDLTEDDLLDYGLDDLDEDDLPDFCLDDLTDEDLFPELFADYNNAAADNQSELNEESKNRGSDNSEALIDYEAKSGDTDRADSEDPVDNKDMSGDADRLESKGPVGDNEDKLAAANDDDTETGLNLIQQFILDMVMTELIFKSMCRIIEENNWPYSKDDEAQEVSFEVSCEDVPMSFTLVMEPSGQLLRLMLQLPFKMRLEGRLAGAIAACAATSSLLDGNFDYDIADGTIMFRITASFEGGKVGPGLLHYMINTSCQTVQKYSAQFLALDNGTLSIQDFLTQNQG